MKRLVPGLAIVLAHCSTSFGEPPPAVPYPTPQPIAGEHGWRSRPLHIPGHFQRGLRQKVAIGLAVLVAACATAPEKMEGNWQRWPLACKACEVKT